MNPNLLILQLAFNALMLAGLAALAWRDMGRRRRNPATPAPRRQAIATMPKLTPVAAPASVKDESLGGLADLVRSAEEKELAAEAQLRDRIARFRTRAAG